MRGTPDVRAWASPKKQSGSKNGHSLLDPFAVHFNTYIDAVILYYLPFRRLFESIHDLNGHFKP